MNACMRSFIHSFVSVSLFNLVCWVCLPFWCVVRHIRHPQPNEPGQRHLHLSRSNPAQPERVRLSQRCTVFLLLSVSVSTPFHASIHLSLYDNMDMASRHDLVEDDTIFGGWMRTDFWTEEALHRASLEPEWFGSGFFFYFWSCFWCRSLSLSIPCNVILARSKPNRTKLM